MGLEKLERGHGDDLVVLAVTLLVFHAHKLQRPALLRRALCYLEYASTNVAYNFYFYILKVLIYSRLGVCRLDIMQTLDIKYIQYDTLTYLVLPSLVASGQQAKARQVMQSVVGFHRSCQHSGPDDMAQVRCGAPPPPT